MRNCIGLKVKDTIILIYKMYFNASIDDLYLGLGYFMEEMEVLERKVVVIRYQEILASA